ADQPMPVEEMADLREDRRGNTYLLPIILEEVSNCAVVRVAADEVGHEWTTVRQDHPASPNTAFAISSLNSSESIDGPGSGPLTMPHSSMKRGSRGPSSVDEASESSTRRISSLTVVPRRRARSAN